MPIRYLPHTRLGIQRKIGRVPFKSDLLTWHKPVSGNDFEESIASLPAKFLPRVASFNGVDDYFTRTGFNLSHSKNPITFVGEINLAELKASQSFIGNDSSASHCIIRILSGKMSVFINGANVISTTVLNINTNYSVGIVRTSSTEWDFYIDGIFIETITGGDFDLNITDLTTGRFDGSHYFHGLISRAAIYDRELTPTEVLNYHNHNEPANPLVNYHPKGMGDYEYDLSPSANHGVWLGTGARYDYDLEGSLYPKLNGYSLWEHVTSDPIQVDFDLTGSPISLTAGVNIPTGYTKTRDVVGSATKWNMADSLVNFDPNGAGGAAREIFDRSNVTRQTALSRASIYYDATSLATRSIYHITEIAEYAVMQTFFEAGYQDRASFGKVRYDGSDIIGYDEHLNYATQKTGVPLTQVKTYCNIP